MFEFYSRCWASFEMPGIIRDAGHHSGREAFRVTPAVTKVDSSLRDPSRAGKCMRFFQKLFHLIEDYSRPCGQIGLSSFLDGVKGSRFQILKARGPGKFCSPISTRLKVLEMRPVLEFRSLSRRFSMFV